MSFNPNSLVRNNYVPPGVYTVLVHNVTNDVSNSGNPMSILDCEILAPDQVASVDSKTGQAQLYKTGHTKFRAWWAFVFNDFLGGNIDALKALGVKVAAQYESPAVMIQDIMGQLPDLLGRKAIQAMLVSRPQYARKPLTAEDLAKGIKEGEILRNPATGKEIITGNSISMQMTAVCGGPHEVEGIPNI